MESFSYDHLNRLSRSQVAGCPAVNVAYSRNGNIETKTGLGDYAYASAKTNAVTSVTNSANLIPSFRQDIAYTHFDKTASVTENDYELAFDYGHDNQRRAATLKYRGTLLKKMYYAGNYEYEELTNRKVHYIAGPDGLVCIAVINGNAPAEYYYAYKDHLGSILTLTDGSGNVVAQQNFDAWGRSRNPDDWTYSNISAAPDWLYRGFTGHEHLPEFALINMNGRLYDPVLSRMLRPDNFVQNPFGTQGYNRYSYAWNNPLSYTDPNGEFIQYIIGAIVGGVVGTISGHKAGLRGWELFGFAMMNAGIGAATAGIGTSVSASVSAALPATMSAAASGAISGMAAGAVSGFVGGFYGTVVSNAFGVSNADPFKAGLIGMGMGAAMGAATGAISGGIQARMQAKMQMAQARQAHWDSYIACEKCGRPDAIHSIGKVNVTAYRGINWSKVFDGSLGMAGGLITVGTGIYSGNPFPITVGIPVIGFGMSEVILGLQGKTNTIPGGTGEAIGIGLGGNGTYGQVIDIVSGGYPKSNFEKFLTGYDIYSSNIFQNNIKPLNQLNRIPNSVFLTNSTYYYVPIDNTRVNIPIY